MITGVRAVLPGWMGSFGPVPTTRRAGNGRTITALLLALVLAAGGAVGLGATGRLTLVHEPVVGRPIAILKEIVGPETGPPCPLDRRYVDEEPTGLRPHVLDAWHRLEAAADVDEVRLCLNDGKRSVGQQQREFDAAVHEFGSPELASRYVLQPDKSMHVQGLAVDVQPLASTGWVERNGPALGWCRRYANEPWHFEYDPGYATAGCPLLLPSATRT
jgi:D-alanyl-D-alanine carboxypeptidase